MALIKWNETMESGIAEFDETSRLFVLILNSLDDALKVSFRENAVRALLMKLNDYTAFFEKEEQFMEDINFPGLKEHKQEHREFGRNVEEFILSFSSGKKVELALLSFLAEWMINHILAEDRACIEFAAANDLIQKP